MKRWQTLLSAFLMLGLHVNAQIDPVYENHNYNDNIYTVTLHKAGEPNNPLPLLTLNAPGQLTLSFDEMGTESQYYQYTLVHCDANWHPSRLQPQQYIEGSPVANIEEFRNSKNIRQRYVHYQVNIPETNTRLLFAGNYIVKVYRNFDENQLVLTRRMMVVSPKTRIQTSIRKATNPEFRNTHQEVDMVINHAGYRFVSPATDAKVVILQNYNWSSAITTLKPYSSTQDELNYNYESGNLFEAGNEYRFVDTRSLRFFSPNVDRKEVNTEEQLTYVYIKPDLAKGDMPYLQIPDFNGKMIIANKDGSDGSIDGDYGLMHFSYPASDEYIDELYIVGEFTGWRLNEKFRMQYDPKKGGYVLTTLLKQGYYSYLYCLSNEKNPVQFRLTEGNHSETENEYVVLFYGRNLQFGYDELIGVDFKNSVTP